MFSKICKDFISWSIINIYNTFDHYNYTSIIQYMRLNVTGQINM